MAQSVAPACPAILGPQKYPRLLSGMETVRSSQVWKANTRHASMSKVLSSVVAIMDRHNCHVAAWRLTDTVDAALV